MTRLHHQEKGKIGVVFGTTLSSSSRADMHYVSVSDRVKREVVCTYSIQVWIYMSHH